MRTGSVRAFLVGSAVVLAMGSTILSANAAVVTIWEDQFTSVSSDWTNDGTDVTFVSQSYAGPGSTDGFEALITPNSVGTHYNLITLPPAVVSAIQIGDILEISARNSYPTGATTYAELINTGGGSAAVLPFSFHDGNGNGAGYVTRSTAITSLLRSTNNLYLGTRDNDGSDGLGFQGVDYIRITGDRPVPEPTCGIALALVAGCSMIRRKRS